MPVICKLKELMDERGLSQLKLAQDTGLSPTTIGSLYRHQIVRRIDCDTAEVLMDYFGLKTLSELYERRTEAE
ncbi:helix-turn-helix domain-containing protein [Fischerella sp. PCC 9605]|uniref:helix-turn-helix domain-containing protein n=1 Tax=Fischerella sp. PCC 9605 TaxID=1173024 RepID=UPI00047B0B99|nr:helix-turn-helix transcriptional regulator [Fischerella sp. PCC 9605]